MPRTDVDVLQSYPAMVHQLAGPLLHAVGRFRHRAGRFRRLVRGFLHCVRGFSHCDGGFRRCVGGLRSGEEDRIVFNRDWKPQPSGLRTFRNM